MTEDIPLLRPEELDEMWKQGFRYFLGSLFFGWVVSYLFYPYLSGVIRVFEKNSQETIFLAFVAASLLVLGRALAFAETGRVLRERREMRECGESWEEDKTPPVSLKEAEINEV